MKQKIWMGISLCVVIIGLVLCFYSMFSENASSHIISIALLFITAGNLINIRIRKKQQEMK